MKLKNKILITAALTLPVLATSCTQKVETTKNTSIDITTPEIPRDNQDKPISPQKEVIEKPKTEQIKQPNKETKTEQTNKKDLETKKTEEQPQNNQEKKEEIIQSSETKSEQPKNENLENKETEIQPDFNDLESLQKDIIINNIYYKKRDALVGWSELKYNTDIFISLLNLPQSIKDKYQITYNESNDFKVDQQKGVIENILVTFNFKNHQKTYKYKLSGFKITENNPTINHKEQFLNKKTLNQNIRNLFPSLLAHMILYSENPQSYSQNENKSNCSSNDSCVINYESLLNKNRDLFKETTPNLNISLKTQFFEINETYKEKYVWNITAAKYNDLTGSIGLQVEIRNSDDNHNNEPDITQEFEFDGLRSLNPNNQNPLLSFFITPADLKDVINNLTSLKNKILNNKDNNNTIITLTSIEASSLKTKLFNKFLVSILDNQNTYHLSLSSQYTKNLLGLTQGFSIYPFYTHLSSNNINNLSISIEDDSQRNAKVVNFTFNFKYQIAIQNSYSSLRDNSLDGEHYIKLEISSQVPISGLSQTS
ncbi:LppA/P72 family lipoprotein [Mycoplasmopsis mustelae]|uniref:LppA/P72 family lipoprotein n=1 Tax=Mycoplasmopsis mustelae TaxID=171289 RepID=A0A4R7UCE4_9BACT|nr:hypothetical protein [Mycoplasmopsis mustelae]TDV24088.1 LppA/P72 family lipoprotein [Mycoplasmopsis mustelae]